VCVCVCLVHLHIYPCILRCTHRGGVYGRKHRIESDSPEESVYSWQFTHRHCQRSLLARKSLQKSMDVSKNLNPILAPVGALDG
jgi:hypothetical protein